MSQQETQPSSCIKYWPDIKPLKNKKNNNNHNNQTHKNKPTALQKHTTPTTQQKITKYFTQINKTSSQSTSSSPSQQSIKQAKDNIMLAMQNIQSKLQTGSVYVSEQCMNLSEILCPVDQHAVVTQMKMMMIQKQAIRNQRKRLITSFNKQINSKNSNGSSGNKQQQPQNPTGPTDPTDSTPIPSNIYSKQQHQQIINKIKENKQKRQQQTKQLRKQKQDKLNKMVKANMQRIKQKEHQQRQQRRHSIESRMAQRRQKHFHIMSQQIQSRKSLKAVVDAQPLYVKMQKSFVQNVQMPELEQKKRSYKKLRQLKSGSNRYDIQSIKSHQIEYIQCKTMKIMQQSKASEASKQSNYIPPEKTTKLQKILQEQLFKNKKKFIQHKQQIQQKQKREQNYVTQIRQKHKPKIDIKKQKQIENRLNKQLKLHQRMSTRSLSIKDIGNEYLNQMKKINERNGVNVGGSYGNKKNIAAVMLDPLDSLNSYKSQQFKQPKTTPSPSTTTKPSIKRSTSQHSTIFNKDNLFIDKIRQKRLQKLISSDKDSIFKLQMLEIEAKKLNQAKNMKMQKLKSNFNEKDSKQASNLALGSLKAKMSLIQMMKNQNNVGNHSNNNKQQNVQRK